MGTKSAVQAKFEQRLPPSPEIQKLPASSEKSRFQSDASTTSTKSYSSMKSGQSVKSVASTKPMEIIDAVSTVVQSDDVKVGKSTNALPTVVHQENHSCGAQRVEPVKTEAVEETAIVGTGQSMSKQQVVEMIRSNSYKLNKSGGVKKNSATFRVTPNATNPIRKLE